MPAPRYRVKYQPGEYGIISAIRFFGHGSFHLGAEVLGDLQMLRVLQLTYPKCVVSPLDLITAPNYIVCFVSGY